MLGFDRTNYGNVEVGVSIDVFFNPKLQLPTMVWSNVAAGAKMNSHREVGEEST